MAHMPEDKFNRVLEKVQHLLATCPFASVQMPTRTLTPFVLECLRRDIDPGFVYGVEGNFGVPHWQNDEDVRYGELTGTPYRRGPAWQEARVQYLAAYA